MSRIAPHMKTDTGVDFGFHTGQVEIFTKQDEQGNEMRFLRGVASGRPGPGIDIIDICAQIENAGKSIARTGLSNLLQQPLIS